MLILFDQGTPVGIRDSLPGHTVKTANQQGWSTLLNGELLRRAEDNGFDVLLTTDKNLAHQQNLSNRKIAIVVLGAKSLESHPADARANRHCSQHGKAWQLHSDSDTGRIKLSPPE